MARYRPRQALDTIKRTITNHTNAWLAGLFSISLVLSRRPDALMHPQFWAEDGAVFFSDAYRHGWLRSLFMPYAGTLQTAQRVVASIAALLPLRWAPLIFVIVALLVQILPVVLLWTKRFQEFVPNDIVRLIVSFYYLAIPNSVEIDSNLTNVAWHLALVAVMILATSDVGSKYWRWFERIVLAVIGLTGPFVIFLAPISGLLWLKSRTRLAFERISILACCLLIQVAFLATSGNARGNSELGITLHRFVLIVGGKILMMPIVGGERTGWLVAVPHFALLMTFFGLTIMSYCLLRGPKILRILIVFSAFECISALFKAINDSTIPIWQSLTQPITGEARYFFLPMLAWLFCLIWLATKNTFAPRILAGMLLFSSLIVGIPNDWTYTAFTNLHYQEQVKEFEAQPSHSRQEFQINPGWTMVLIKR